MHLFLIDLSNDRYQFLFILCFTELSSVECHRSEDWPCALGSSDCPLVAYFVVVVLYTENVMVVKRRDLIIEHLILHFTIYVRNA